MDTNMTASATMPAANAAAPVKKNSNFQAIVKRLFQNRGAVIGLIIFIVLALAAIFAPVAAPYGYEEMDLTNMLSGPSLEHLFGTDELGRDVFSRIIYGGRYSLSIGLAATAFGVPLVPSRAILAARWTRSSCAFWIFWRPSPVCC